MGCEVVDRPWFAHSRLPDYNLVVQKMQPLRCAATRVLKPGGEWVLRITLIEGKRSWHICG